jgi:hypothetical protein
MVISQSVAGNRNPKLFSQLNELYGNARTVHGANDNHTLRAEFLLAAKDHSPDSGITMILSSLR